MKIVLAPDKFKSSLTGLEFCDAVEHGIKTIIPEATIVKCPLADGGDGTIEILSYHLDGEIVSLPVSDPLFRPIVGTYLYIKSKRVAFIEMAEASGMKLLDPAERNCFNTTSFGTGELILDAIKKGATTIVLGIGGSATNDCGIGMATALGYGFEDEGGKKLTPIGKHLNKIKNINSSSVIPELNNVAFKVASDVTNPLYGPNGAAHVYGPQKGASAKEIEILDQGLRHFSKIIVNDYQLNVQNLEGAGAAGGMGAGAKVFLNAQLNSGINLVKEMINFESHVHDADWIITGEGKLDEQTLSGKTIHGVLTSARKFDVKVAALCGAVSLPNTNNGMHYIDSVIERAKNLDDAMANSKSYVNEMAKDFAVKRLKT